MKTFDPLIVVVGGEALASTEVIADGMSQKHSTTIKLVRKHLKKLNKLGRVRF